MSIKLPRTAIAATLAATLLLAGCGDSGDDDKSNDSKGEESSQTSDPSDEASEETSEEPSEDTSEDSGSEFEELDSSNFYKTVVQAQVDAGTFKGRTSTTAAGQSIVMDTEASYADGKIAAKASTTPDSAQQVETILVDGVMYIKGDGLGAPAGKYLKLDTNKVDSNDPLSSLVQLGDPEMAVKVLDNPKKFELIGTEDVEGVEANHYQITMDGKKYAENAGMPQLATYLPAELVFDMWVDAENRPVKMVQELEVQGQKSTTETLYFDYGADVSIEAPADSETVTP